MRERNGRTLPFISSEAKSVPLIEAKVAAGSTVYANEATAWNPLHDRFTTKRINHSECYSDGEACTNHAESFFSRMRRAEIGTHHHIAGPYLNAYADEMAWREDSRPQSLSRRPYCLRALCKVPRITSNNQRFYLSKLANNGFV
jgi:hypothetical protein